MDCQAPLLSDLQQHLGGVPDGVGKEGVDLLGLQPRLVGQPLDQDLLLPGHPPAVLPVEEAAEQIALAKALRPQHHRVDAAAHLAVQTLKGVLPAHVPLPAGDGAVHLALIWIVHNSLLPAGRSKTP